MSKSKNFFKKKIKEVLKEELSPQTKSECLEDAREEIETTLNKVLVSHGVHKQGLADQQCAKFYRELSDVLEETLDLYRTTRKPSDVEGVEDYEEFMDMIDDE